MTDTALVPVPLEPIALEDIPDRGGTELVRASERARGWLAEATLSGVIGCACLGGVSFTLTMLVMAIVWNCFILAAPVAACLLVCMFGTAHYLSEAAAQIGKRLDARNPARILPAGHHIEDARFENALRDAATEFNTVAADWNAYTGMEGEALEGDTTLRLALTRRRERIMKGIRFLQEGGTLKSVLRLEAAEPKRERPLLKAPEKASDRSFRTMFGPSHLVR